MPWDSIGASSESLDVPHSGTKAPARPGLSLLFSVQAGRGAALRQAEPHTIEAGKREPASGRERFVSVGNILCRPKSPQSAVCQYKLM